MSKLTANKLFFLAGLALIFSFLMPVTEFKDLTYVKGVVSQVSLKENGVGAFIEIKTLPDELLLLNVAHLREEPNKVVRALGVDAQLEVWYSSPCCQKGKSVWQLKNDGILLRTYEQSHSRAKISQYLLIVVSFVFFLIAIIVYYKSKNRV